MIDFASRTVDNGQGDVIFLNDKEFQILKLLIEKTPQVMSREDILNTLKEPDSASHRTIDNVVVRLRQILNDENHNLIKSIRGVGYQWVGGKNE